MAMHNTNSLLKLVAIPVIVIIMLCVASSWLHRDTSKKPHSIAKEKVIKNVASGDSAAESLDTLTADLSKTKQKIIEVSKENEQFKKQNTQLLNQVNSQHDEENSKFMQEIEQLKNQIQSTNQKTDVSESVNSSKQISIVDDLTQTPKEHSMMSLLNTHTNENASQSPLDHKKPDVVPYYTIPANGTSVKDKLMTALVGRIPVKGVVTDPYPFKIVISDDNLAANGLRIPHLLQMIVSGYCEGDLNLVSVRGWVTSLTFVFDDGTISSTTSNDNDIGNYTKSNSLGYLSDKYGNPFIRGKLITNAPTYLSGSVAIDAGVGAANAYAQSQTTNGTSIFGNTTSTVTGSPEKYAAGQALSSAANGVQQWWRDREEQSFDAIYVAPAEEKGSFVEIAVNFAKEIHIDYDPKGRKLNYENHKNIHVTDSLD
jgi:hypothetical protein